MGMKDKFQEQSEQFQQQAREKMDQAKEQVHNRRGQRRDDALTPQEQEDEERFGTDYDRDR
ncbi:hypothetical protein [Streptomyces sp. JB150]|uniref:hypothetical protein n=1 Tax=Streptomyces sp. JB150 TaxID=2714844 RepID=UPI0014082F5D|nr:hypothetical protein [Streptomyces sp. JB150]QIJ63207.1 hypothetical protein G7Z13_15045 [Streptomyces sp. JB150]